MLEPYPSCDMDEPHTLRSDLPINGIVLPESPDPSPPSCASYSLQISDSYSAELVTGAHKSQCEANGGLKRDPAPCGSSPSDASDLSCAANPTAAASKTFSETKGPTEELEHEGEARAEDIRDSLRPAGLGHTRESHGGTMSPGPPAGFSVSDLPPSVSDLPPSVSDLPSFPTYLLPSSVKFFSFVILHVPGDEDEAQRVCAVLHRLQIMNGTTFCEGFETAGQSPLRCLEDAVENSAYVVLLLTDNFKSRWGEFKTNVVLMNSIQDQNKCGTVIPLIPRFNPAKWTMPLYLRSLTRLEEKSAHFKTNVQVTFKENVIKTQREKWEREQAKRLSEKQLEDAMRLSRALEEIRRNEEELHAVNARLCQQLSLHPT
ncbi:uncharacterized protein C3orf18 homolog isoform X1 [Ranitomeya variabilis]|uniref:uncharacterized protein C3orf18 homolog isoform X1 n=1 Tax=Ranitomeya variabilis TaxID=490064 RepID=UPI00405614AB